MTSVRLYQIDLVGMDDLDRDAKYRMMERHVLVPVTIDRAKLFEAFDQCEEMETEAEVVDHLLAAILGAAAVEWFTILERLGSSIYKMDQSDPLVIEAKEQFLKIATSMTKETMGI